MVPSAETAEELDLFEGFLYEKIESQQQTSIGFSLSIFFLSWSVLFDSKRARKKKCM
jgi:hypothetical protein